MPDEFISLFSQSLPLLEILNLSGNQLKTLPHSFQQFTQLKSLDCSENNLVKISSAISKLTNLTTLILSKNRLSHFPKIQKLPGLEYLDISNNPSITKIGSDDIFMPKGKVGNFNEISVVT